MMTKEEFWKDIDEKIFNIEEACKTVSESTHSNYDMCKECGGRCCKSFPCGFTPSQVKQMLNVEELNIDNLRKFINRGDISIDYWSDHDTDYDEIEQRDNSWYFLRYRARGAQIADYEYDGGYCMHLNVDSGCDLPFDQRGMQAQALIPNLGEPEARGYRRANCESPMGKRECALMWLHYNEILEELWNEFWKKEGYNGT